MVQAIGKSAKIKGKPFLKWAGGKTQLLSRLLEIIPGSFGNYFEPFVGGGALFFGLNPENAFLSDMNEDLIITYKAVQNDVELLIETLGEFVNNEEEYYRVRAMEVSELSDLLRAARFIYLNRTCFNGLYRVNKKGKFNVPYGKRKGNFILEDRLRNAAKILKNAKLVHGDYKKTLLKCQKNDLVFLDPPYYPVGQFSDFKRYTKDFFYHEDQVQLKEEFANLVERGCHVILTNSNHPVVMDLYKDYEIIEVNTKRLINSDSSKRKGVDVIVAGR